MAAEHGDFVFPKVKEEMSFDDLKKKVQNVGFYESVNNAILAVENESHPGEVKHSSHVSSEFLGTCSKETVDAYNAAIEQEKLDSHE